MQCAALLLASGGHGIAYTGESSGINPEELRLILP